MKFRKLIEGVETDSLGNQLTPEQSRYFKNSKIRDRNGNLLVVHHGTYNSFDSFDAGDIGFHFGTEKAATERKDYYDDITDGDWKVGKYYLNITNFLDMYDIADWDGSNLAAHIIESRLLDLSDEDIKYLQQIQMMGGLGMGRNHEPTTMLRKFLTDRGIDGIMYENAYEDSGSISYIAFNPEQIKFITNKTPTSSKNMNEDANSALPSIDEVESVFTQLGLDKGYQINHSVFIFPDGKAFYGNTHEDFYIELCDRGLIDDYYDDFLVTKHNCIRCCDIDDYENYIELPKTVTTNQLHTLEDWLNKAENRYCYDHLQVCSRRESFIENVYDLNTLRREGEDVVKYIMNRIKRFVSSGVLLEDTLIPEPNVYVDFVNELHSKFNSMSTEQIISFLNINQRNDLDTESPMFILPNGKFVSVQETLDTNGVDVDELTHQSICECFAWRVMGDLNYDEDTIAEIVDQDWRLERELGDFLTELTYKLGWARINCGTKAVDRRFYGVLPNEVTNKQWWSLETWLNWGYDKNKSDVLIFVTDSAIAKKFKMNDFAPIFPEDIVKTIRRFYSSGRFYEGLNERIENLIIDEESSDYDKLFVADSVRELKKFMDATPWEEFKVVDSSDHDGNYYVGDALHYIHSTILRKAVDNGYFPGENYLTVHRSFAESELVLIERGRGQHRGMFGEDWYDYMFIFEDYTILARDDIRHTPLIKQFGKLIEIREFDESGENPNGTVLTEGLNRLASNAFITDSPYRVRDLLMNKPKLYRILYDSNIDMYMIGDGDELIHWDLIKEARKQGYYASMEEFIDELGDLYNYVEFGDGGQFLGDEEIESYLIYMVFSPDEDSFYLGEDGYQFRYKLPFGYIYTRDSYLDDCDLYNVVKGNITINEEKKMRNLIEGVWALPDNQRKVDIIKKLFKKPITADDIDRVKDTLYNVLGSDELFDILDSEEDIDYRYNIAGYLRDFLDDYSDKIDKELADQLEETIGSFDRIYKKRVKESYIHTNSSGNPCDLVCGSALKVGDSVYDDKSGHKLDVIEVEEMNSWSKYITFNDTVTGKTEQRHVGNLALFELAGEGDEQIEVDDDIEIEWHPIDDYFD